MLWIPVAGAVVGVLYGLFGVGASFATPALAFLGVPPLAAVVAPLPAFVPGSMAGAWSYARRDKVDWALAGRVMGGAVPAAVAGAGAAQWVDGELLVLPSTALLLVAGARLVLPGGAARVDGSPARRSAAYVPLAAVGVGFVSGLLANGGGFLLVPWFLLGLGLDMHRATGTSLLVAASLTVPTLATHVAFGSVDWRVALPFAVGVVPGTAVGGLVAHRLPTGRLRLAFGAALIGFSLYYVSVLLRAL